MPNIYSVKSAQQPTVPKVARAVRAILQASETENPYLISEHRRYDEQGAVIDCDEPDLWFDDFSLVPREHLEEGTVLFCPACEYNYRLWESLLEQSVNEGERPTAEYGTRVFAALSLEQYIQDGFFTYHEITAREYDDLCILKTERRKLEAARAWERAQEAAQQAASTKRG